MITLSTFRGLALNSQLPNRLSTECELLVNNHGTGVSKFSAFILANHKRRSLVSPRMEAYIYIPSSLRAASRQLRLAEDSSLAQLAKRDFLRAWCSILYLFPGLHPDTFFDPNNDWPQKLKGFAAEAWRRFESGELASDEFYCYQAATTRIQRECARLQRVKPWLFSDHFGA